MSVWAIDKPAPSFGMMVSLRGPESSICLLIKEWLLKNGQGVPSCRLLCTE